MNEKKTTFDGEIKPRMYVLVPSASRKLLGGLKVGEIVRITIEKLETEGA